MDDPLPSIILQFFLILLNAFFACTEIAVISLNDAMVKRAAESGDKKARMLVRLIEKPAHFLATIQVGITLAGFLGSAFAANNFSAVLVKWAVGMGISLSEDALNTIAVILITIVLSFFTLVLGELVPKRIAMQRPEPIARAVASVIMVLSYAAAPLVWLLTASTNLILRLLRLNTNAEEEHVTEEEIRIMVDLGEEKGAIAPEEGEMIDNVLELSDKTAVELMTHRTDLTVLWLEDDPKVWEQTIYSSNYSRYPVCGDSMDKIMGVLHVRDFFCNLRNAQPVSLKELLRPAYFVPETARADMLLRDLRQNRAHMAIVVDEYGGTSGVLTMEDLVEEIVGQIEDEHDDADAEPDIITLGPDHWRVRGSVDIATLSEELAVDFPEGDYDTLGGLIFAQMHSIPIDGTHPEVDVAGVHIVVEELTDHRVEWADITAIPPELEDIEEP